MNKSSAAQPNISSKIGSALATLACVMAVLLCIYAGVQIYTQGYVSIGGFSMFRVVTGSMEPNIPVGALLLSENVPISQVQEDDVVCFISHEETSKGKVITHRVIGIHRTTTGAIVLETQGDANLVADHYFVTSENLIGKVAWHTKGGDVMTGIMNVLTSKLGFLLCIVFPILMVAGFILRSCVKNIRRELDHVMQELEEEEPKEEDMEQMKARIRQELLEEMKQGVKNHEGTEESEKTE